MYEPDEEDIKGSLILTNEFIVGVDLQDLLYLVTDHRNRVLEKLRNNKKEQ